MVPYPRAKIGTGCLVVLGVLMGQAALAKLETWKQDSAAAFAKARKEGVVVADTGRIRLAHALKSGSKLEAAHVWDLLRTPAGVLFAATGDEGKVFRRDGPEAPWTVAYDADDTQALSLAALADGRVFVGTGPSGQLVEVTDPKHPAARPDPSVKYIWDLAADAAGNLYAATGPTGQLWKRTPDGKWSLLLDSPHPHLLCVALGPDGSVYAGSDGAGLVYRVARDGKVSVVFDAPQDEVRALLVAPDGTLYAGTAAAEGGAATTASSALPAPPGGTAQPKPPTPGENAVYSLGADGAAREVFRAKLLVFALAWQNDRLLIGTGPEGQVIEVRRAGRESTPIARLDHGQVLALLTAPDQDVLLGAGDPGAVLRLSANHAAAGVLTSSVLDTKLISRFGALSWRADQPAGTTVALQVRTGNVGEPDETWSAWSPPQRDPDTASAQVPPGRFAQYRVRLETKDPHITPEVWSVALRYQTLNLAPELTKIDVPDLSEGDGATRQPQLTVKWDASDPNGDDLSYTLHIRKEGWPDWVRLGDRPLTEKSYTWDTFAFPEGRYRLRITATDRPSNPPDQALTRELVSEPFLIDHEPPRVTVQVHVQGENAVATIQDSLTRLAKASYSLDGGDWVPVFPEDGLFDQRRETIPIRWTGLRPGVHVLTVRATDAAGNTGAGDAVFESK